MFRFKVEDLYTDDTSSVSSVSSKRKKSYIEINKIQVKIASLRNSIKFAKTDDELVTIANKILDLEEHVSIEKTKEQQDLEERKRNAEEKIARLERELQFAKKELEEVDNQINYHSERNKTKITNQIDALHNILIMNRKPVIEEKEIITPPILSRPQSLTEKLKSAKNIVEGAKFENNYNNNSGGENSSS